MRITAALLGALVLSALAPAAGFNGSGGGTVMAAEAPCTHYADPAGNDANPGTSEAQPKKSPIALLNALPDGGVGCLKDGATFTLPIGDGITSTGGTPAAPKTLRPKTPGQRATISAQLWFQAASHDIVLRDLNLTRATNTGPGSMFLLDGDRITLDGIDAWYPNNICLDIGEDPRAAGDQDPADDIIIRHSRIHDCGVNHVKGPPDDSGVHGIYAEFTRRILIEDNLIYRNNNRGIQLYPDADDSIVRNNVLHANGANLNIGSENGTGNYSTGNDASNNILNNSYLSSIRPGVPDEDVYIGDGAEVLGNFPAPPPGGVYDNHVDGNCIRNVDFPNALYAGDHAFTHVGNVENQSPLFQDPANGNFSLGANSPCLGKGPDSGPLNINPAQAGQLVLGAPVTDNYKDCFNAPDANRDRRTFFQLGRNVVVNGNTYRPTDENIPDNSSDPPTFVGGYTLNMTGPSAATLVATPTGANNIDAFFWRIDAPPTGQTNTRGFGPFFAVTNPLSLKTTWIEITLRLMQGATELGSTVVRYRYEDAIYNANGGATPQNCSGLDMASEANGPGGRWWVGAVPSRLNWEGAAPAARTLTVTRNGTGDGTVSSSPVGVACPSTCSATFINAEPVSLSRSAAGGSTFAGWGGACAGTGACAPAMTADRLVTATFNTGGGDATAPTVTAPTMRIRTNTSLNGTQIPVTVAWTGSDNPGGTGIKRFELQQSNDGGVNWTPKGLATLTSTTFSPNVPSTGTTLFRVRGVDNANPANISAWQTTTFTPRLAQQTAATYTGSWATSSSSSFSGGSIRYSSTASASASFLVTADWVGFVTTRASNRGVVKIYLDGTLKATIDLYNGSAIYRRSVWSSALSAGQHTVKIVVNGTPSARKRVDVDAFTYVNF